MISPLSDALAERGFDTLTPVQEAVTDPALAGADLLVSAQTGSGKTVGFGLAIAPTLLGEAESFGPAGVPMALIIAPTRELALQVMRELGWLYAKAGARVVSCVGGMDFRDERRALERGAHVVVGTPGRLRDHIERGSLDMSGLRAVVLDEADEMLDLGFREDLEFMLGEAPEERRTLLFSATLSPVIEKLASQYQRDAQRISTMGGVKQHADISYQAVRVAAPDAEHAIFNLLRFHDEDSAIVFANTRAVVNHLTARLANRGFSVVSLSGELSQTERTHALQAMRDGRARVCVATDVAARGIDLPNLTLVIHADLPTNTESLLHRSGRTGRAGRKGISALIVPPKMVSRAERLLKWAKISAEWTEAPSAEAILQRDEERLLNDPAWEAAPSEDEAGFAEKLLARHSPEAVAAAYLRLYRARRSAPEDLLPADAKTPQRERKPFGPSRWFALSVGRDDRAEARWLLPLLCRAGNLEKEAIGAIRVQDNETFVEITEAAAEGFLAALGEGGTLEDGVTVRTAEAPPERPARGPAPRRESREPRDSERPRKPRHEAPERRDTAGSPPRPERKPEPMGERSETHAPRSTGAKPYAKSGAKPWEKSDKPRGKPEGKSWGKSDDKPRGKPEGKPWAKSDGKPGGKPGAKPWSKPEGKPGAKPWAKSGPRKEEGGERGDDAPKPNPWAKPGYKPAGKPGARSTGKPGGKPAGKPFGKPGGKPAGKPGAKPGGKPFGKPGGSAGPRKPR